MNLETFESIRSAIEVIQKSSEIKRIDGKDWSVYIAGNILRIDIKMPEKA